jgi:predicted TIM-barrel fold metal-dependent hydrolase
MLIDWHSHHSPPEIIATFVERTGQSPPIFNDRDSPDFSNRIQEMDEAGIEIQLVCQGSTIVPDQLPSDQALEIARRTNDLIAERIAPYSGRLMGVITVSVVSIYGSVREIERMASQGFRAVQLYPRIYGGAMLDSPTVEPLFAKISELGLPIFLHGSAFSTRSPRMNDPSLKRLEDGGIGVLYGAVGDGEVSECVVRLIASGLFDRYPNLQIVIRSGGGGLPLLLNRLSWKHKGPNGEKRYSEILLEHFLVDTAGTNARTLQFLIDTLGEDRVVFGSDYCGAPGLLKKALPAIQEQPNPEKIGLLLERNARKLLRL